MVKRYFPEGMKISLGYFSPTTEFVLASDYDALAAELAACKTARDGWTRASDAAHARIRVLESALTEVKAVLRETHGGRHYEPECPECVWLDGATALETFVVCPDWGGYHNFNAGRCSCGESNAQTYVDRGEKR